MVSEALGLVRSSRGSVVDALNIQQVGGHVTWPDLGQQQSWEQSQAWAPSAPACRSLTSPSEVQGARAQALLLPAIPTPFLGLCPVTADFLRGPGLRGMPGMWGLARCSCIAAVFAGLNVGL